MKRILLVVLFLFCSQVKAEVAVSNILVSDAGQRGPIAE